VRNRAPVRQFEFPEGRTDTDTWDDWEKRNAEMGFSEGDTQAVADGAESSTGDTNQTLPSAEQSPE
jgi:hypothetical protein